MPPRSAPTARQERLGAELRKMRERAGVSGRAAAALLGSNPIQMSHVETGKSGISEERIRRLAAECACDDTAYVDALVAMATTRGKGWWEEFRGTVAPAGLDLAELEHDARAIRTFQVVHIPGLLQTEDHMHAAFRYVSPDWPTEVLDAHLAFRLRRQTILSEHHAAPYEAVIHEAALRIRVGGRKTAQAQLEHILNKSDLPNVSIRVLPFDTEDFAGAGHSMLYAEGPVHQLDTVQLDTTHGTVFHDTELRLRQYRKRYERVEATALDTKTSRHLISRIVREL